MEMNANAQELHELEKELHTEILPGTEIMTDVGSTHFVKGRGRTVLVPQPTADPADPLNWSPLWKTLVTVSVSWISFTQGFGPLSLAPQFPIYIKEFNCSLAQAVQFTGVAILVLGFSNFFWVPLSTTFGRRPTALFSQLINFGAAIWRARAQSYGSFMGACVLNGFAAGPAETMQPAVIADIYFLHDRGTWNTLYFVVYFGSLMIGPIISGPMSEQVGWRNFWWLYTAMIGLSIVMIVFIQPETLYHRIHPSELAKEKSDQEYYSTSKGDAEVDLKESPELAPVETAEQDPHLGRGRPSKGQFGLFKPNKHPIFALALDFWIPWKLFAFPIVHFASFVVSWSASCFLTLNLTQAQVFAAPPYNFHPTYVGFTNFAVLVGSLIGLATSGPLSDWIAMHLTRKNGGIREPEMRLPTMIPYVLVMILGNFIAAFGYQQQWPWPAIVVIGYGCAGLQVAALPAIASTYAVDSYKPVAGSLFVSITVNKNLWGYGFSKFITPWTESSGFVKPIMLNMCLTALWCFCGVIFYYYGKTFRRWTKNDKVHLM